MEILADAFPEITCFAHVDHGAKAILHQIHTRLVRELSDLGFDVIGGGHERGLLRGLFLVHREKLNGIGDDILSIRAIVADLQPMVGPFVESECTQCAKEFVVLGDVLLIDAGAERSFAMTDFDQGVGASADVEAMRHTHLIEAGVLQVRNEGYTLFTFSLFLVVQVADADVGRGVGGVLPAALENSACFIQNHP